MEVGQVLDVAGSNGILEGDKALVYDAAGPVLVQRRLVVRLPEVVGGGAAAGAASAPSVMGAREDDQDARVLPVRWKGDKRLRSFAESVDMMEHVDFGDCELEGEPTCAWYLQKSTGLTPVAR